MKIIVPEDMGGDLRLLPVTEPTYEASVSDIFLGKSGTGNPKATVKYIVTSEYTGPEANEKDFESTVGAVILETFSLQEQAIWRINDFFKQCTGDRIPQGDYDEAALLEMLKKSCVGTDFNLLLKNEENNKGVMVTSVEKRDPITKSKLRKGRK